MIDKLILIIKYIIVSIIQGIGEILPISSSGHMIIIKTILNLNENDLTFEIFLHFASLLAIVLFFFKKIWTMAISFFSYIFNKIYI
jgi:undecaprenyl-diphosphatase